jgi:hypothetical protein
MTHRNALDLAVPFLCGRSRSAALLDPQRPPTHEATGDAVSRDAWNKAVSLPSVMSSKPGWTVPHT